LAVLLSASLIRLSIHLLFPVVEFYQVSCVRSTLRDYGSTHVVCDLDYSAFIAKLYQPVSPAPVVPRGKLEFTVNTSLLYLTPIGGVLLLLLVLWLAVRLSRDNTRQLFPGRGRNHSSRPSHQEYFSDSNNDHLDAIPMRSLENTEFDHESITSERRDVFANEEEDQSIGSAAPSSSVSPSAIASPNDKGKSLLANLSLDDSTVNSSKALLPAISSNVYT
jgi:hypothetical protein